MKCSVILSVLAMVLIPVSAIGQHPSRLDLGTIESHSLARQSEAKQQQSLSLEQTPFATELQEPLARAEQLAESKSQMQATRSKLKAISSVADVTGEYVMTYNTVLSKGSDRGGGATITQIEGTDSVLISTTIFDYSATFKGYVNVSASTITIPNQYIFTTTKYGDVDIACCNADYTPDRATPIEGTINSSGTITWSSTWGAFITSGSSADQFFDQYNNTLFEPANATMSYDTYSSSSGTTTTNTFNVIVEQTGINVITVKNFGNFGQTLEIVLNADSTATIASQMVRDDQTYGDWYTYSVTYSSGYSSISSSDYTIACNKASDAHTISWGDWNMVCDYYYWAILTGGTISIPFDLSYPTGVTTSLDGEGTESSPYLIKSIADLVYLSDYVNSNQELHYGSSSSIRYISCRGQYYRLEDDIDMTGYRLTPIGSYHYWFGGQFDGNDKTITGLEIDTGEAGYAGLFGFCDTMSVVKNLYMVEPVAVTTGYHASGIAVVSYGTISNCHVTGGYFNSLQGSAGISTVGMLVTDCSVANSTIISDEDGYCGGLAGEILSTVSNCSVTGTTVIGNYYYNGGLVGCLYGGLAENCYFEGTVDGSEEGVYNGGIAGYVVAGVVSKCYNMGKVTGQYADGAFGGLVGLLCGGIINSYSVGHVEANVCENVGGLVGLVSTFTTNSIQYESYITNSYSASAVVCSMVDYDSSTRTCEVIGTIDSGSTPDISGVYFDNQITNLGSEKYGLSTADMTSASGLSGFDSGVWIFSEGYYPRLGNTEADYLGASAIIFATGNTVDKITTAATVNVLGSTVASYSVGETTTQGQHSQVADGILSLGNTFGTDTIYLINSSVGASRYYLAKIAPVPFDGSGTEDDPYLIKTKSDLVTLSTATSGQGQNFPNTYFLMTADIDLESDTSFVGISSDADDDTKQFQGNFNGGGHKVSGMKLVTTGGYQGFIGRLALTGTLRNLTIDASATLTSLGNYSAALVGYNYGAIDSCQTNADITATESYVGGVTGYNASSGKISTTYNGGNLTVGAPYAGGIAGVNAGSIVTSQNAGDITLMALTSETDETTLVCAGGITGDMQGGIIASCLNQGAVTAYNSAGGIAGTLGEVASTYYTNDVTGSINYGTVFTTADDTSVGEIGGTTGTTGTISTNYYDNQITLHKAAGKKDHTGITGVETSTLTSGIALDGYSTDIWDFTTGVYPVLNAFASQEASIVKRAIIITLATGETVADLLTDAPLSTANDCAWTLVNGSIFAIEDYKLVVPASVSTVVADTLVATAGSYTKKFAIKKATEFPLTGSGTIDSPYIISTATEWNALANYIAETAIDLTGKYTKLGSDISFVDTVTTPLSYDGITLFNGDLDGDGKTISGITVVTTGSNQGSLFYQTGSQANIHDLTVEGTLTSSYEYTGGVVGSLYGSLSNVTSKMTVITEASYSGGIVGVVCSGASLTGCIFADTITSSGYFTAGLVACSEIGVKYENCGNIGTVSYTGTDEASYTSGLIAYCYPDTLIGCYNSGIVETSTGSAGGLGGLIAYANSESGSRAYYLENCYNSSDISSLCNTSGLIMMLNTSGYTAIHAEGCYNTGNITSTSTTAKSSTYTNGLFARITPNSYYHNCWNSGDVTCVKSNYTSALIGYRLGDFSEAETSQVIGCYNNGNVTSGGSYVTGIVGYIDYYMLIDSCYNTGNITGKQALGGIAATWRSTGGVVRNCWNSGNIYATGSQAGGLINSATYNEGTIYNCYNTGDVTTASGYNAGGILGAATLQEVSNCWNTGNITAFASYAGGIVGRATYDYDGLIKNCWNAGTITTSNSTDYAGGIVGYTNRTGVQIVDCYNVGDVVSTASYAGGIMGYTAGSISGCYSAGAVTAATDYAGGVLGYGESASSVKDGYSVATISCSGSNVGHIVGAGAGTITGNYYLSGSAVYGTDSLSTGLSYAELAKLDLGDSWTAGDNYTYPRITTIADNDYARAYAAAVVPAEGDSYSSITSGFNVGMPDGVTWTASTDAISFNGNTATFTETVNGTVTLTATCGDVAVTTEITCNVEVSGISDITGAAREVVEERFYSVGGAQVAEPTEGARAIYIVVKSYSDGTTETVKEVR